MTGTETTVASEQLEGAADATGGNDDRAGGPRPGVLRRIGAPALAGVLLVLAVVAAIAAVVSWRASTDAEAARQEVVEVSTQVVRDFISIEADGTKTNVDRMLAVATEPFRTELGQFSEVFGAILAEGQVSAEGDVDSVGIERLEDGVATALVSASTTVRNTEVPDGAPRDFRLLLELRHEDGAWKVSTVEVAP